MRVCLLAFDGLEWTIASKMPSLAQAECRKVRNDVGMEANSPILWTTIITGELPEVHGVNVVANAWDMKPKCKTWFDLVEGSITIQVPCVNCTERESGRITGLLGRTAEMEKYWQERFKVFKERANQTFHCLDEKPPLLMTWFWTTDLLGHLYAWDSTKMRELYDYAGWVTAKAVEKMGDEGLVVVVSDHGMECEKLGQRGTHTNYAFFSSSVPIGFPQNPHLTDIFPLILKLIKTPPLGR